MLFWKILEIFKNTYLVEHLRTDGSVYSSFKSFSYIFISFLQAIFCICFKFHVKQVVPKYT